MYWLATRSVLVSFPSLRLRSLARLFGSHLRQHAPFTSTRPLSARRFWPIHHFKEHKALKVFGKTAKKAKTSTKALEEKDLSEIFWWKERLQLCRKPSTLHLINRLVYTNLLGLNVNLKNGSLKEGTLNWEVLQFKSRFPREVLLCRVGDFYEAIGIDACILVEYAGLNPFGGLRSDSIPRAGCPVMNLRQTLDDLTRHGYSVCIVEEIQGPTPARSRKGMHIQEALMYLDLLGSTMILTSQNQCLLLEYLDLQGVTALI